MREGEIAYFVAEAPVYEIRDGHVVATRNGTEYVLPISVAQQMVLRLTKVLHDWRVEHACTVLKLAPRREH